jgi:hypothetical protein
MPLLINIQPAYTTYGPSTNGPFERDVPTMVVKVGLYASEDGDAEPRFHYNHEIHESR